MDRTSGVGALTPDAGQAAGRKTRAVNRQSLISETGRSFFKERPFSMFEMDNIYSEKIRKLKSLLNDLQVML